MKKNLFIFLGVLAAVGVMYAASGLWITIQASKTFTTTASITDTSSDIPLKFYPVVELQHQVYGTDSVQFRFAIDGKVGTVYNEGIYYDTLTISESTTKRGRGIQLRGWGTNNIKGYEVIRIRTTHGAVGADDSLSALYYTQKLLLRN